MPGPIGGLRLWNVVPEPLVHAGVSAFSAKPVPLRAGTAVPRASGPPVPKTPRRWQARQRLLPAAPSR